MVFEIVNKGKGIIDALSPNNLIVIEKNVEKKVEYIQANADWNSEAGVTKIFNKPIIPVLVPQVQTDWNATTGIGAILNRPTIILPAFVTIDEGKGNGIIIRGRVPDNYAVVGFNAIDLSYSGSPSTTLGATGNFAFAANREVTASGYGAAAFGNDSIASGQLAFVTGSYCVSSGVASFTGGQESIATRDWGFSFGYKCVSTGIGAVALNVSNFARSAAEISVGYYGTDYTPVSVLGFSLTDRIFNVGVGTDSINRLDGLTLLKNGLCLLPTVTNTLIAAASGKAIVTKEYLVANTISTLPTLQQVLSVGDYAEYEAGNSHVLIMGGTANNRNFSFSTDSGVYGAQTAFSRFNMDNNVVRFRTRKGDIESGVETVNGNLRIYKVDWSSPSANTQIGILTPTVLTSINFPAKIEPGTYTIATTEELNLQKVITYPTHFVGTTYTLSNNDSNYEIIIDNGATAVTIAVPAGLLAKIGIGFTQKGTGDVNYLVSGTTIRNPIGLKIKGQYHQTFLSQELATNNYFLGGNTKV